jgi:UDP-glucose 4-epimerase
VSVSRVCITGGAGFVGSHLARELLRRGTDVVVIDNAFPSPASSTLRDLVGNPHFTFISGSTVDRSTVERAAAGCSVIYHLASIVGVRRSIENALDIITINLQSTFNVLDVARQQEAKVVLTSSADVYGVLNKVPLHESDRNLYEAPNVRRWVYARVKSLEEELCFEYYGRYGLPTVVLRYFNSYGPDMDQGEPRRVLPLLIEHILKGEDLLVVGDGTQTRSFCYISDLVEGTILAGEVDAAAGKVFNIGNDEEIAILDLAKLVLSQARSLGIADGLKWRFVPVKEFYGEDFQDVLRRVPDLTRAREVLGYQPRVDLPSGVHRTLSYYRSLAAVGMGTS